MTPHGGLHSAAQSRALPIKEDQQITPSCVSLPNVEHSLSIGVESQNAAVCGGINDDGQDGREGIRSVSNGVMGGVPSPLSPQVSRQSNGGSPPYSASRATPKGRPLPHSTRSSSPSFTPYVPGGTS